MPRQGRCRPGRACSRPRTRSPGQTRDRASTLPSRRARLDRLEQPVRPSRGQRYASANACNPNCQRASTRVSGAYRAPRGRWIDQFTPSNPLQPTTSWCHRGLSPRHRREAPTSDAPSPSPSSHRCGTRRLWPRLLPPRPRERPRHPQPGTPSVDRELRRALNDRPCSRTGPVHKAVSPGGRSPAELEPPCRTSRNRPATVAQRPLLPNSANTKEHGHACKRPNLARPAAFSVLRAVVRLRAAERRGKHRDWRPEGAGFAGRRAHPLSVRLPRRGRLSSPPDAHLSSHQTGQGAG